VSRAQLRNRLAIRYYGQDALDVLGRER